MNIKKVILIIVLTVLSYSCIIFYAFQDRSAAKIDVVAVNDIAESIAEQWEALDQNELPCLDYGLDYVVLDNEDSLVAVTREGLNYSLNAAISNRDTVIELKKDETALGILIIYNDTGDIWARYRETMLAINIFIIISVAILCLIYAIGIDRSIYRPFRKLQGFARHVAEGRLDLPLEMDKGNSFGAFTESFDLMREELRKARENERIANQSKKELVASLSHDIKTPVASIKAVSEVMYARATQEYDRKQLETINAKADQINTLITNMFNATLEELQELKVTVTEQSSQILYSLIKNADYNNQVVLSAIPECIILVDSLRLEQVIDNIINNSYKYAGTSINVSVYFKGQYLEFTFKDYGPGVSEDENPLLFNKFYRAENANGKSGSGLGLYISKYLVTQMKGTITSETTPEGFSVILQLLIA
ncbi:MAG TPA: HAMP domain-containing sensor histidine kinase [Mobilitalea sp.]|nr:HAMP domain-containing sensor histidine kinase [Mobilitalea sp.]